MSTRTPVQAIAHANTITRGYAGLCLVFVRTCFGIGAKYPTAAKSWANAQYKHETNRLAGIPAGVPIHFEVRGEPAGHVALYLGGGKMRTNVTAKGTVETVPVPLPGHKLLGWTEDLNGVRVYTAPKPTPSKVYTVKAGDTLSAIAVRNKTTTAKLMKKNPSIEDADLIRVGQKIKL
ncbi:LysM peptidoglycan-binding domain-containing protein [Paeniglutamicibacter sp. NPDC012692]|uniref:LysM peptidoglycan-binding domain-containing protein n=1 Tax=Paeniglutamicibacter sp. NPDC012692 TaxID=3364388 RepID=UPI0036A43D4E